MGGKRFHRGPGDRREVSRQGGSSGEEGVLALEEVKQPTVRGGLFDDLLDLFGQDRCQEESRVSISMADPRDTSPMFITLALLAVNGQTNHVLFSELFLGPPFHHTHLGYLLITCHFGLHCWLGPLRIRSFVLGLLVYTCYVLSHLTSPIPNS